MGKTKNQLRRWLYIDKRIRSGDYPNTTHFIKGFLEEEGEEISIRTIMRDLEFLKTEFNELVGHVNLLFCWRFWLLFARRKQKVPR